MNGESFTIPGAFVGDRLDTLIESARLVDALLSDSDFHGEEARVIVPTSDEDILMFLCGLVGLTDSGLRAQFNTNSPDSGYSTIFVDEKA